MSLPRCRRSEGAIHATREPGGQGSSRHEFFVVFCVIPPPNAFPHGWECRAAVALRARRDDIPGSKGTRWAMADAYVYDGLRTPIGRHAGALAPVRPDDLLSGVIKELVGRNPFKPEAYED